MAQACFSARNFCLVFEFQKWLPLYPRLHSQSVAHPPVGRPMTDRSHYVRVLEKYRFSQFLCPIPLDHPRVLMRTDWGQNYFSFLPSLVAVVVSYPVGWRTQIDSVIACALVLAPSPSLPTRSLPRLATASPLPEFCW